MNKETFNLIMKDLNNRINRCNYYLGDLKTTADVNNLPLRKIVDLRDFCSMEYEVMTTALMVDLYHILGMGNLSPMQTSQFIKGIRTYSSYRSLIQSVNSHFKDFTDLPNIPTKSTFKLLALARGLILSYGPEDGEEIVDSATIEDYDGVVKTDKVDHTAAEKLMGVTFIDNKSLTCPMDNLSDLCGAMKKFGFGEVSDLFVKSFLSDKEKSEFGVRWKLDDSTGLINVSARTDTSKKRFLLMVDAWRKLKIEKGVEVK